MAYSLSFEQADCLLAALNKKADVYAPMLLKGTGRFSETDVVRYGKVNSAKDIVLNRKSEYSFKEQGMENNFSTALRKETSRKVIPVAEKIDGFQIFV